MKIDYELINGKPHFGLWFGQFLCINNEVFWEKPEQDPVLTKAKRLLDEQISSLNNSSEFEIRYREIISRPWGSSFTDDPLIIFGTMGHKYVIWGRAYKVMRITQSHTRRKKKIWLNGRRVRR